MVFTNVINKFEKSNVSDNDLSRLLFSHPHLVNRYVVRERKITETCKVMGIFPKTVSRVVYDIYYRYNEQIETEVKLIPIANNCLENVKLYFNGILSGLKAYEGKV